MVDSLLQYFPALAALPRVRLIEHQTPVTRIALGDGRTLLLKRDDLSASPIGGNKVRGLEWLLGGVRPGDHVLTVGPRGSTHAFTTAAYAKHLGASTTVVRWDQHMHAVAERVDRMTREVARVIDVKWTAAAYSLAAALRLRGARWIPAGGATPLAILGHVGAAMEFARQIADGECETPAFVVVPLGTGGTAAGLALGFRIAGVPARVVAVRVVPRIVGRRGRVVSLANRAARLIERMTGERVPRLDAGDVDVEHAYYGGSYGRPLGAATPEERALAPAGVRLDDTYSRKAFAAAVARQQPTLLWLTFDGRLLQD